MKKLCIIQPFLPDYRREVFLDLGKYCAVDLMISPIASGIGFKADPHPKDSRIRCLTVRTVRPFGDRVRMIQWGTAKYILRERPDAIIASANPRYLSFWTAAQAAHNRRHIDSYSWENAARKYVQLFEAILSA